MAERAKIPSKLDLPESRQRDLIRVIYVNGGATLREVHAQITDPPPSICGIRTLLNRLVRRGILQKRRSGRNSEIIYLIKDDNPDVILRAFLRIANENFGGSKSRAYEALLRLAADARPAEPRGDHARAA